MFRLNVGSLALSLASSGRFSTQQHIAEAVHC